MTTSVPALNFLVSGFHTVRSGKPPVTYRWCSAIRRMIPASTMPPMHFTKLCNNKCRDRGEFQGWLHRLTCLFRNDYNIYLNNCQVPPSYSNVTWLRLISTHASSTAILPGEPGLAAGGSPWLFLSIHPSHHLFLLRQDKEQRWRKRSEGKIHSTSAFCGVISAGILRPDALPVANHC